MSITASRLVKRCSRFKKVILSLAVGLPPKINQLIPSWRHLLSVSCSIENELVGWISRQPTKLHRLEFVNINRLPPQTLLNPYLVKECSE